MLLMKSKGIKTSEKSHSYVIPDLSQKSTLLISCLEMLHPDFALFSSNSTFCKFAEILTWSWSVTNIYSLHNLLQKGNHTNKNTEKQQYPSLLTQAPSYSRNAIIPSLLTCQFTWPLLKHRHMTAEIIAVWITWKVYEYYAVDLDFTDIFN